MDSTDGWIDWRHRTHWKHRTDGNHGTDGKHRTDGTHGTNRKYGTHGKHRTDWSCKYRHRSHRKHGTDRNHRTDWTPSSYCLVELGTECEWSSPNQFAGFLSGNRREHYHYNQWETRSGDCNG